LVCALFGGILLTGCNGCSSLLYHPTQTPPESLGASATSWQPVSLATNDENTLRGVVARPKDNTAPWVLFFGGNAMSLASSTAVLSRLRGQHDWGLAVFAYRGYDGSTGSPDESSLVSDAQRVALFLRDEEGVRRERLVVMGQSLGTGVAVQLAAAGGRENDPVGAVVLLSPYTSMTRVFGEAVSWLPSGWLTPDAFESAEYTDALPEPTLIIHGMADDLIGIDHGRELAQAMPGRARLLELPGRGHNDVWTDPRTTRAIRELVSSR
jgi:uncharacterized protein